VDFFDREGVRRPARVISLPLRARGEVIGVFGCAHPREGAPPGVSLTPRQRQVLGFLAEGKSTPEIARQLDLARETVRNHVRGLLRELRVHSRLEALAEARRR